MVTGMHDKVLYVLERTPDNLVPASRSRAEWKYHYKTGVATSIRNYRKIVQHRLFRKNCTGHVFPYFNNQKETIHLNK